MNTCEACKEREATTRVTVDEENWCHICLGILSREIERNKNLPWAQVVKIAKAVSVMGELFDSGDNIIIPKKCIIDIENCDDFASISIKVDL